MGELASGGTDGALPQLACCSAADGVGVHQQCLVVDTSAASSPCSTTATRSLPPTARWVPARLPAHSASAGGQPSTLSVLQLPPDCLDRVWARLGARDLARCACACRAWRTAAGDEGASAHWRRHALARW